jgi:DivIVA domain-containing protein
MSEVYEDRPDTVIPAATLSGQRIKDVRFSHSIRGYRQDEVDTLLDLVAAELDRREQMLRDADIPLEPSAVDVPRGGRRRADPRTTAQAPGQAVEDRSAEERGYPWDGPDSSMQAPRS